MCAVCGCEGKDVRVERAHHGLAHDHVHGDGELHAGVVGGHHHEAMGSDHAHAASGDGGNGHAHAHGHDHVHRHLHWHEHDHVHADGTRHSHAHAHGHSHAHGHVHSHGHEHDGEHAHDHGHGHEHGAHGHGSMVGEIRAGLAARRAMVVLAVEVPGAGALAALDGARRVITGTTPTVTLSAAKAGGADFALPGPFESSLDAHVLLHALEGETVPMGGMAIVHAPFGAAADVGADHRVVFVPVSAGVNLAADHPSIIAGAALVVVTDVDRAASLGVSVEEMLSGLRAAAPGVGVVKLSVRTGEGVEKLAAWLKAAQALRAASH